MLHLNVVKTETKRTTYYHHLPLSEAEAVGCMYIRLNITCSGPLSITHERGRFSFSNETQTRLLVLKKERKDFGVVCLPFPNMINCKIP